MSNGTTTVPPSPEEGHTGSMPSPEKIKELRKQRCGFCFIQFLPAPPGAPALSKKVSVITNADKTKSNYVRWSVDNLIYFYANPSNDCTNYEFMQFVKRTTIPLNPDGTEAGPPDPAHSTDWRPDVEGWNSNQQFTDFSELIYNGHRVQHDPNDHLVMRRQDGPGYGHLLENPPTNLKMRWEFKVYVVCDVPRDLKVVCVIEFGFDIIADKNGNPRLEFPKKGEPRFPKITNICCNRDDSFLDWIDQWHHHEQK